jgi:hypothetical protein
LETFVTWQSRPVFITSTFQDMHAERDFLREHVFPELEERLRERFHYLEPIDLRLGVETIDATDAGARELLILKVCLGEIERSRPFLIGLIGDRYGWVPPADRMHAAAREAGFERDLAGRSVTALEIEFGVLGRAGQIPRSRFYLRNPLPYDEMPPDIAAEFSEAHSHEQGASTRAERLTQLRQLIEDTLPRDRVRPYQATWDSNALRVVDLETWGHQVVQDLWTDLETETQAFVAARAVTWQEQEARLLKQFVATACREFVGREDLVRELVELANGAGSDPAARGACIVGPPGSGKSALFAERLRRLQSQDVLTMGRIRAMSPPAPNWARVRRPDRGRRPRRPAPE